jgi:hypothetical protein
MVHSLVLQSTVGMLYVSADHSGRAVYAMNCLRSLQRWDRGFESHSRHGCVLYAFILCVGRGLATG